jgi:hypothetical protein
MKPRVPIDKLTLTPPPDPIDGMTSFRAPTPRRSVPADAAEPEPDLSEAPVRNRSERPKVKRYAKTFYLEAEDLQRLSAEQVRLQRKNPAQRQGVSDASGVIRRLIREHLPSVGEWE